MVSNICHLFCMCICLSAAVSVPESNFRAPALIYLLPAAAGVKPLAASQLHFDDSTTTTMSNARGCRAFPPKRTGAATSADWRKFSSFNGMVTLLWVALNRTKLITRKLHSLKSNFVEFRKIHHYSLKFFSSCLTLK